MKLVTQRHDACGEPATKQLKDWEEVELWSIVDAHNTQCLAVISQNMVIRALTNSYSGQLNNAYKAAAKELVSKYGWNKWDIRTTWTLDEE